MKIFVSFMYSISINGTIASYVGSTEVDCRIKSLDDVSDIEKEIRDIYEPVVEKKGGKLLSIGIITWRQFDK